MKKQKPTQSNNVASQQILKLIPRGIVGRVARETGVDLKARSFSVFSHVSTMIFAQLTHAISLNDVCDWLRMKRDVLGRHGLSAPSRNGLSHANKNRDAAFMEKLFWEQLAHLQRSSPSFASGNMGKGLLRRFKVRIHAVDSTVILAELGHPNFC